MFARRYLPSLPALLALEAVDRLGTGAFVLDFLRCGTAGCFLFGMVTRAVSSFQAVGLRTRNNITFTFSQRSHGLC